MAALGRTVPVILALILSSGAAGAQTIEYYHVDAIGSIRAVTNASGQVVERHEYLPFGEEWNPPSAATGQPKRFAGKERDVETGLDYFGARYYASRAGRFTTVDPVITLEENLFDPQRWNRYAYVRNNPLRYTDRDGRAIDFLADIGLIGYDLFDLGRSIYSGEGVSRTQLLSLGGDLVGAVVPGLTGVGLSIRAASKTDDAVDTVRGGTEVVQRAMSWKELRATQDTGLLRGGRAGTHHVSDGISLDARRARQRLALPVEPDVRVTMEVPAGVLSPRSPVPPLRLGGSRVLPGRGSQRTATGQIPVKILRFDEMKK